MFKTLAQHAPLRLLHSKSELLIFCSGSQPPAHITTASLICGKPQHATPSLPTTIMHTSFTSINQQIHQPDHHTHHADDVHPRRHVAVLT